LSSTGQLNATSQSASTSGALSSVTAAQSKKLSLVTLTTSPMASPVNGSVSVTRGGYSTNLSTRHHTQTLTILNTSANTIVGPIYLEVTPTVASVQLFNKAGLTIASSGTKAYVVVSTGNLLPGKSATVVLQWSNPLQSALPLGFTTNVIAGGLP